MKAHLISILLGCLISFSSFSQTEQSLLGKWKFKDLYNVKSSDSAAIAMLKSFFKDISISFQDNKRYEAILMAPETGSYEYDASKQKLVLTADKGVRNEVGLKVLDNTSVILSFEKDKSILLEKVTSGSSEKPIDEPATKTGVSITPAQLCKKWYFKSRFVPNRSDEYLKLSAEMFAGTFYDFRTDFTYTVKVLSIEESGTWKLSDNNSTLSVTANGETKFWLVKRITDTELELYKGKSQEFWTFSIKP